MKNIIFSFILAFAFLGCNSKSDENQNVEAKLVVGKSLSDLNLKDQHEQPHKLSADTKVIFFSFSKPTGHACNAFLEKQKADFLAQHKAVYVADVSAAPSLIKSMFILPDLKKLQFPILLINDDNLSAAYSKGMDKEKIIVVFLDNMKIKAIKKANNEEDLKAALQ